jgi:bacterioferritin (cytochrome b1)
MKYTTEFKILNDYFWAEMGAGLLVGKWLRKVEDFDLVDKLLAHTQDEFEHAQFWKKRILQLGFKPVQIHQLEGKPNYFVYLNSIKTIEEFLCAVHAYEKRIPWHLNLEKTMDFWSDGNDQLMTEMIRQEMPHINWIKNYLTSRYDTSLITEIFSKVSSIENETYIEMMKWYVRSDDPNLQKLGTEALLKASSFSLTF